MTAQAGQSDTGERISDLTDADLLAACADMIDIELERYLTAGMMMAFERGWSPTRLFDAVKKQVKP